MIKMARTNFLQLNEEEKDLLDDLVVETSQALEMAHTYTNILNSTLEAFATIISNKQNKILQRLITLIIFLSIPFLIIGIFGMNVPIPYKDSHYAFWLPVSVSLLFVGGVIWDYFKRLNK